MPECVSTYPRPFLPRSVATLENPVSLYQARLILSDLLFALEYAHGQGIVHCDIKPTNILLSSDGSAKLIDWGLSRSILSAEGVAGFSPRYSAPEQRKIRPICDKRTDIWQVGLLWAELLTGRGEIPSGDESVFQSLEGARYLGIIRLCLAFDPAGRYQTVQQIRQDLNGVAWSDGDG